ncbi:Tbingi protein [Trypanosoma cruzi]|nr:Tbingi protein [Trypanosoma cruzi]
MKLEALSVCLPPSCTKSMAAGELDGLLCADGPQLMGADVDAHTEAWDRSIPSDSRGDTIVQRCIEHVLQVVNGGECTRYAERQGSSASRHRPVQGLCRRPMGSTALTGQWPLHHPS